ncbi:MAG TPA: polysaccharide lyase family protein [Acidobacteriaceae bacterium]|jgi:rhamnogalacturonan endolyase
MPLNLGLLRRSSVVFAVSLCALTTAFAQKPSADKVTVTDDGNAYVLSNGIVVARIEKKSGDIVSYKYKGTEITGHLDSYPPGITPGRETGYWSHDGVGPDTTAKISIDPASNGGQMAEVEIKAISHGQAMSPGAPGNAKVYADIDIHWALARGDSGVYTYMQLEHQPDYPSTIMSEARFCMKLADFFDWMAIGPKWDKPYPKAGPGEAHEDKYDFTADQFDSRAYGWSSSTKNIGLWLINPTVEYLSGGPTKVEFLGHRDTNSVQAPIVLNYWRSSHYGGAVVNYDQGEHWDKVVGPFMLYVNSGGDHEALYKDAVARMNVETQKWPYEWVNGVDYPKKGERVTVSGHLVIKDPQVKGKVANILIGLTAPAYTIQIPARTIQPRPAVRPPATGAAPAPLAPAAAPQVIPASTSTIDWQTDAKHYEFWVRVDAGGNFSIPNVRPGTYTMHAIANGVLGEYTRTGVTVEAGKALNLGNVDWTPVRYGRQIWEIGIPNRTGEEFAGGKDYSHDGTFLTYATQFPNDVTYTIGKSDYAKDWFFEQVPHNENPNAKPAPYNMGTGQGRATPWTINFDMPKASTGKAHLRLGLASTSLRQFDVEVNGQHVATVDHLATDGAISSNGIHGVWSERDVPFDASLLKPGANSIRLVVPAASMTAGIIYDYLRLEVE